MANHVDYEGLWFGDCSVGGYPIAPTSSLADYTKIRWELVGRPIEKGSYHVGTLQKPCTPLLYTSFQNPT